MDLTRLNSLFFTFDEYILLFNFITFIIAIFILGAAHQNVLANGVLLSTNGFMSWWDEHLFEFTLGKTELLRFLWYGGFAFFNLLAVLIIYRLIKELKIRPNYLLLVISFAFVLFTIIQALGYIDRFMFSSNLLITFYQYSIPTLNVTVSLLAFFFTIGAFFINPKRQVH